MIKLLNKRFPKDNFPPIIVHIMYLAVSVTFCYLYYHKLIVKADFYGEQSSGGIYAVLNNTAYELMQVRVLLPIVFIVCKKIVFLVRPVSDGGLFFALAIVQCYFILLSFYFLLNKYFQNRIANLWISPVIIYPMVWNYIIMNGQFFYMDFGVLLGMTLGFYFIVSEQNGWLLLTFYLGLLNHSSVGFLIPAYLLFNYKKMFRIKTIIFAGVMSALYIATYAFLDYIFPKEGGYFLKNAFLRNLSLFHVLPIHIIVRDLLFVFGGLHFLVAILIFTGFWRRFKGPFLYISFVLVPYVIFIYVYCSIEETRNYIAAIPFILIPALLFLSTLKNSFLAPVDKLSQSSQSQSSN